MRLPDDNDYEEQDTRNLMIKVMAVMMLLVITIVGLVVAINQPKTPKKNKNKTTQKVETNKDPLDGYVSGSKLTSDQLDIWTLPEVAKKSDEKDDKTFDGVVRDEASGEIACDENITNDNTTYRDDSLATIGGEATDFSKTLITNADGSEEWIDLNPDLKQNEYLLSGFVYEEPMMKYQVKGEKQSKTGVDVSSLSGEVDFYRLKALGVDFAMIRIGTRGYSSSKIVVDDSYKVNMDAAKKAGLGVGVYFVSQALTKEEILEEFDTVSEAISDYTIDYPVMIGYEMTTEDITRIDVLDKAEKTKLLKLFLTELKQAGYKSCVYGNKRWLMKNIDLTEVSDFDTCVAMDGEMPDYPYQYKMWQYASEATIQGIKKPTKMYIYMQ